LALLTVRVCINAPTYRASTVAYLSETVFIKIVVEMKEQIIFACEFDSQCQGILLLTHDEDLDLNSLQSAHLQNRSVCVCVCVHV